MTILPSLALSTTPREWFGLTGPERQMAAFKDLARLMGVSLDAALWEIPPHVEAEFLQDRDLWAHAEQVLARRPGEDLIETLDAFWEGREAAWGMGGMVFGVALKNNGRASLMLYGPRPPELMVSAYGYAHLVVDFMRTPVSLTSADLGHFWNCFRDIQKAAEALPRPWYTAWVLSHKGPKVWKNE